MHERSPTNELMSDYTAEELDVNSVRKVSESVENYGSLNEVGLFCTSWFFLQSVGITTKY